MNVGWRIAGAVWAFVALSFEGGIVGRGAGLGLSWAAAIVTLAVVGVMAIRRWRQRVRTEPEAIAHRAQQALRKAEKAAQRRTQQGAARDAAQVKRAARVARPPTVALNYLGGHPQMTAGVVRVQRRDSTIFLQRGGHHAAIPVGDVKGCQWVPHSQAVNTGGGLSIGGALVGGALLGPFGALIGSRKRTRVKNVRSDFMQVVVQPDTGLGYTVYFTASTNQYQRFMQATQL